MLFITSEPAHKLYISLLICTFLLSEFSVCAPCPFFNLHACTLSYWVFKFYYILKPSIFYLLSFMSHDFWCMQLVKLVFLVEFSFFGSMFKKVILSFRFDMPLYFFLLYFFSSFSINFLIFLEFFNPSLLVSLSLTFKCIQLFANIN